MHRIVIALVVLLLFVGSLGYWYYQDSQDRIETLQRNSAKLKIAAESNQQTIEKMKEDLEQNQQRITQLNESLRDAEKYNTELRRLFQRHNLTLLAEEKPGLIEKRINDATDEVFDSIMRSTIPR